jgi:Fe-S-cluster containining protein
MRFQCQDTCGGKCCKPSWDGVAGFVYLTQKDIHNLTMHLAQHWTDFAVELEFDSTRFANEKSRQRVLDSPEGTCRFLKDGKCSVYEARPTQCRTFPFWPENITAERWVSIAKACPGVNKGDTQPLDLLFNQIEADKELCNQPK